MIKDKISKLVEDDSSLEAPLFVVHINYRRDQLNEAYENGLGTLAEATGGRAELCRTQAEIPEAISTTMARISSAWRLTLTIPGKIRSNIMIHLSAPCGDAEQRVSWRVHLHPKEG